MTIEFNFRATTTGTSDPSYQYEVLQASTYPIVDTLDGESVTFGWSDTTNLSGRMRDYNSAAEQRLLGAAAIINENTNNTGSPQFRVDIPAGEIDLHLALGNYSSTGGNFLRVYDDATLLLDISDATTLSDVYADSELNELSGANWGANHQVTRLNVTSGILRFDVGANVANFNVTSLAHIGIDLLEESVSITQTDDTPEDGVLQTVTCTGMTGPITAATLGGVNILSDLSGTDPSVAITYTNDISAQAIETNQSQPRLGIPIDLIFTTATDGAVSTSVTIGPKTGWALTEFVDPLNKVTNGYAATIETAESITITDADASYYDASDNAAIATNTIYTSDLTTAGEFTKSILQVGGTSPATSYSDNFYPYGESGGGGGTERKLTYSKLTGVKLTSTKLEASKL